MNTSVTITSAIKLTPAQVETVTKAITKKFGRDHQIQTVIDPTVIGGIKIRIGGREIDGTLRSKLTAVRQHLLENI